VTKKISTAAASVTLAVVLAACGGSAGTQQGGSVELSVDTAAVIAGNIEVIMTVTYPDGDVEVHVGSVLPYKFIDVPCPSGDYTYSVTATAGGVEFEPVEGNFTVQEGRKTLVSVPLLQQEPTVARTITAPSVESITVAGLNVNDAGDPGEPLTLTAVIRNPAARADMRYFSAIWTSTCVNPTTVVGPSGFTANGHHQVIASGTETITVETVFTSGCKDGTELIHLLLISSDFDADFTAKSHTTFEISFAETGYVPVIAVNFAPMVSIDEVAVGGALYQPDRIVTEGSVVDRDVDEYGVAWTSSCGISPVSPTSLKTAWAFPEVCGPCTLTLSVVDARGGRGSAAVDVDTCPPEVRPE
jgi:hypothetical protein